MAPSPPKTVPDAARPSPARARSLAGKAMSFGLIGVVNTVIDFGVFWVAVQKFAVPLIPANVLAWLVAVSASYVMNASITFAAESGRRLRWRSYAAFVASGVVGVVANTTTLVIADQFMPLVVGNEKTALALSKLCAIAVSFLVNFSMSHFVVFRRRPAAAEE
jgi:putative flippase GtrA